MMQQKTAVIYQVEEHGKGEYSSSPAGIALKDYQMALQRYGRYRFDIREVKLDQPDDSLALLGDYGIATALQRYPWLLQLLPEPGEHFSANIVMGGKSLAIAMYW